MLIFSPILQQKKLASNINSIGISNKRSNFQKMVMPRYKVMLTLILVLNRPQITDLSSDQILKIKKNIKFLVET